MSRNTIVALIVLFVFAGCSYAEVRRTPEYVPGQLIIKVKRSALEPSAVNSQLSTVLERYNARIVKQQAAPHTGVQAMSGQAESLYVAQFPQNTDIIAVQHELQFVRSVEYAEPNYYVTLDTEIVSPVLPENKAAATAITATSATTGNVVVVAVVDTGVDYTHNVLKNSIWSNEQEIPGNGIDDDHNGFVDDTRGYDFTSYYKDQGDNDPMDEYGHGTHVSGIVLNAGKDLGITGIASTLKIMPLKFLDNEGRGTQFDAATAICYAVNNGAKVINCSWGYFVTTTTLTDAVKYAHDHGVIVVASSGNDNWDGNKYPACMPEVIAVGALDANDKRAFFSNYGNYLDISAPGVNILSTYPGNSYATMTGTSQAAPYVAGVVAMLMANTRYTDIDKLKSLIYDNASDIVDPQNTGARMVGWDQYTGYGKIDASSALYSLVRAERVYNADATGNAGTLTLSKVLNYPNPARDTTQFGYELGGKPADITITIYDLYGREKRKLNTTHPSTGYYKRPWDLRDSNDEELPNGVYIYVVTATATDGSKVTKKQKLSILR